MKKKITEIKFEIIDIEDDGHHLMLPVKINRKNARLLLDTGASRTVFDLHRIGRFLPEEREAFEKNDKLSTGLGTNTLESEIARLKNLKIGDLRIKDYMAIVLDMSHVNISYEKLGMPAIDGVIGSDLLKKYNAVINYKKRSLKLYF